MEAEVTAAEMWLRHSESFVTTCDVMVDAFNATAEGFAACPLAVALRRERWQTAGISHLLYTIVISSGGEAISSKRWFTSGQTAYMGAVWSVICWPT